MSAVAIQAVKEQQQIIKNQETKIDNLEAKISSHEKINTDLENRIKQLEKLML
jgi:cell division protein FtsL